MSREHVVAIVSGGLDSVTMAHLLVSQGFEITIVSFDYGQRHRREIEFAASCAKRLFAPHHVVNLASISHLFDGSSLVRPNSSVPSGAYDEESVKSTIVPNRNAMMINIAAALAINRSYFGVAVGVHGGDHFLYPDCRPEFIASQQETLRLSNLGINRHDLQLLAPFVNWTKKMIIEVGESLSVPWSETWSCYRGEDNHCGDCGTCIERKSAFLESGINDPTFYATDEFGRGIS